MQCSSSNQWTPIGNQTNAFSGTYDGNNKKISNIYIDNSSDRQGLFNRNCGTISNVKLINGTLKGNSYIGGIAGVNNENAKMINCYNLTSVEAMEESAGGIVGYNKGQIKNCTNEGIIKGNNYIGGITGEAAYTSNSQIIDCTNTGAVTSNTYNGGGIVGQNQGFISKCYNIGTINGKNNVGGIVGYNITIGYIEKCFNSGMVNGKSYTGGIAGLNFTNSENALGTIDMCFNKGTISGVDNTGGITGQNSNILKNCYNTGKITATGSYVSGIAGLNYCSYASLNNCYNIGTVYNTSKVYISAIVFLADGTGNNSYYLNTCGAAGLGTSKTSAQLKGLAGTLGSAFKNDTDNINGGYPILSWQ